MLKCIDEEKNTIEMVEGDFGIVLPIELELENQESFSAQDSFTIKIYEKKNEEPLITKTYSNITDDTIEFELSKVDSDKLQVGTYFYDLDWYQGEVFLANVVAEGLFFVREKAGVVNES